MKVRGGVILEGFADGNCIFMDHRCYEIRTAKELKLVEQQHEEWQMLAALKPSEVVPKVEVVASEVGGVQAPIFIPGRRSLSLTVDAIVKLVKTDFGNQFVAHHKLRKLEVANCAHLSSLVDVSRQVRVLPEEPFLSTACR